MSTITHLKAENFLRLHAVELDVKGNPTKIGGPNEQGKSSTLYAIVAALGGRKLLPEVPIKLGETEANIELQLETAKGRVTVKIKLTGPGDGTVTDYKMTLTERRNGKDIKLSSPMAILGAITNEFMFDPWALTRLKPAEQVEKLKEVVGVDTDEIDAEVKSLFDRRTDVNRDLKSAQIRADEAETFDDAPGEPVSVADLMVELRAMESHNATVNGLQLAVTDAERLKAAAVASLDAKRKEVASLERQLADARHEVDELADAVDYRDKAVAEAAKQREAFCEIDTAPLRSQITEADALNAKVRANAEAKRLSEIANRLKDDSDALTRALEEAREKRTTLMESAKWPIAGLSFGEKGVELNGLPVSQASKAQQMRLWAAVGFAASKGQDSVKAAIIHDASLMDDDSWSALMETADEYGAQVFAEMVVSRNGDESDCAVIIDNGTSREPKGKPVAEPDLAMAS